MKLFYFLPIFVFASCAGQTPKSEKLIAVLTDLNAEVRGTIIEVDATEFRFDYYDIHEKDSHYETLTNNGYQGGGPSWVGIIYGAIKMSDPEILSKIRFDEESDGVAIWSSDKNSLDKIGRLIAVIKKDEALLTEAIKVAEKNWQME
jgi:hypothetical protein